MTPSPDPWVYSDGVVYSMPVDNVVHVEVDGEPREHHTGMIALVYGHHVGDHYTQDDNGRLFAAAPSLLAALKDASEVLHNCGMEDAWERAVAVIALAEGAWT